MKIPLVFLPGMLCDSASWEAQAGALASRCKISVASYGDLNTLSGMADRVLEESPRRFALCGHSMGGRVAQEIYRKAPDRVIGVGLFGTDYRGLSSEADRQRELDARLADARRAREIGMVAYGWEWALRLLPPGRAGDRDLVASIAAMVARHSPEVIVAQSQAGAGRPDYGVLLPKVHCPALVCAGALDTLRPIEPLQYMASVMPDARLVVIENAGHMMTMEEPEQTSLALRDWIDRIHGAP
jgi:pimeloyl-ACP methyl ester carboxylesterase